LYRLVQVDGVAHPVPRLGRVGPAGVVVVLQFDLPSGNSRQLVRQVAALRAAVHAGEHADGLEVHVTGQAGVIADTVGAFDRLDTTLVAVALAVVALLLLLVYRSPGLLLVPLATSAIALSTAQAVVYLLARYAALTVNAQSNGILTVLVIGAGTDYALLVTARQRERLRAGDDPVVAARAAVRASAPAVIGSALTVVLALLCLVVARLNSDRGVGLVGAVGVAVAAAAATTFLPAALALGGRRLFWPARTIPLAEDRPLGAWERVGRRLARRPRPVWLLLCGILGLGAAGMGSLHVGLPQIDAFVHRVDSVAGERALPPALVSVGSPTIVVADATQERTVRRTVTTTPGVGPVLATERSGGRVAFDVLLTDPVDSAPAFATVRALRTRVHALPGAHALVGGATATLLDVRLAARHDRRLVLPLALLVVALVLGGLLRAVVAPLVLVGTVVLSYAASLGLMTLVWRHALGYAGIDDSVPLISFVFLVALGVDYNIFLVTRVREEARTVGHAEGVVRGLAATGGVVTSAGVVLAATFGALALLPLVALVEIGTLVAVGVLVDTLLVRSLLVPALALDLGPRFWYPATGYDARSAPPSTATTDPVT
jgi:RND superfamily putative drug exporter